MLMLLSNPLGRASHFFSVKQLFLQKTSRCAIELNRIIGYFFSQTQKYFIILLIGYKFRSSYFPYFYFVLSEYWALVDRIFNCSVSPYDDGYRIFSVNCSFYTEDSNHAGKYKHLDLGLSIKTNMKTNWCNRNILLTVFFGGIEMGRRMRVCRAIL